MPFSLSELTIYPIKSIQGIHLQHSHVDLDGLRGDRRYMLVKPDGQFISGREYPTLTLIRATQTANGIWTLSHPKASDSLTLDESLFSCIYLSVTVWDDTVAGQKTHNQADAWFSELLDKPIQLVFFGEASRRQTHRRPNAPVTFADGYPFLLTTQASLDDLNKTSKMHIEMAQFRPNLVVQGNEAFAEDSWKRIRIGSVEFENVKPCVRCIFTTLNPATAESVGKGEPLKTLGKFRLLDNQEGITFGINMVAVTTGEIQLGDSVEILEYQEADHYIDRR
ncbi:MOSC domain-containing protein [Marinomonas sp. A79]|uniref:MOSC domain-containing protein n=1 Tax=Marinomonas vulgaris TaxID=2823372 RepID=A0ABS5HC01_9GAMM|nr:MOSC domain-containing protein [Marinomonas vulgaris]MBR7888489.1 MOSC domain-containing protein [Marinomonas vulgaris]